MVLDDLIFLYLTIYGKLAVIYMESKYFRTFIGLPLRFTGEMKLSEVKEIGNALRAGVHIPDKILQEFSLLGSFGSRKKPRVVWVGFEQSSFFSLLKSNVDRVLEGCGIPIQDQAFTAHLTLGRVRSMQNLSRFYNTLDEMRKRFQSKVLFEKLVFYQSILGSHGPEYQVLEELFFS